MDKKKTTIKLSELKELISEEVARYKKIENLKQEKAKLDAELNSILKEEEFMEDEMSSSMGSSAAGGVAEIVRFLKQAAQGTGKAAKIAMKFLSQLGAAAGAGISHNMREEEISLNEAEAKEVRKAIKG